MDHEPRPLGSPAGLPTAWLASSAAGQYYLPPPLLPGLLFPPSGSTSTPSATAWLLFSAFGQYYPRLPLLPGLLFPPPGSTTCRLRYCLACFFRHRAVLPAASATAWLAFPATGQYTLPPLLLPGLLFPPPGSSHLLHLHKLPVLQQELLRRNMLNKLHVVGHEDQCSFIFPQHLLHGFHGRKI